MRGAASPGDCGRCRQSRGSPTIESRSPAKPARSTWRRKWGVEIVWDERLARPAAPRRFIESTARVSEIRLIPDPHLADEIHPGDSIADKLLGALRRRRQSPLSGDILIIKHKIVSKAEGRLVDLATSILLTSPSRGRNNMGSTPASSNWRFARAAPSSAAKTACSSPRLITVFSAPTAASTFPTSTEEPRAAASRRSRPLRCRSSPCAQKTNRPIHSCNHHR